jgi:hypothetical protein
VKWFRMYNTVLNDPKIHRLTLARRWRWVEILSIASANGDLGIPPCLPRHPALSDKASRLVCDSSAETRREKIRGQLPPIEDIAFFMRVRIDEAQSIMADMIRCGLVDELPDGKGLAVHDWDEHQKNSDSSAARVRDHRERNRNVSGNSHVTLHETLQTRDSNVLDTDTDTEREENTPLKPPKGGKRVSSFELPEWVPRKDWDDFLDMRKRQRKAPTDRAKELLVAKLGELRSKGDDPSKVLQRSIERNWQGLFPLEDESKPKQSNGYHKPDPGAPKSTLGKIQRPNLPRTPEFEDVHAMWDKAEANLKRDREIEELDRQRGIRG